MFRRRKDMIPPAALIEAMEVEQRGRDVEHRDCFLDVPQSFGRLWRWTEALAQVANASVQAFIQNRITESMKLR